jgi:hypothetical protein
LLCFLSSVPTSLTKIVWCHSQYRSLSGSLSSSSLELELELPSSLSRDFAVRWLSPCSCVVFCVVSPLVATFLLSIDMLDIDRSSSDFSSTFSFSGFFPLVLSVVSSENKKYISLIYLFVFVCVTLCPTHTVLCFCKLVLSCVPVSLDSPFLIDPSVFSNVY